MAGLSADEVIAALGLEPHPEGGWYRQTWREPTPEPLAVGAAAPAAPRGRAASTAIYYLLRADELSRWHRVDATEVFHHYGGAPLELRIAIADGAQPSTTHVLGDDLAAGHEPQVVVPARSWQSARSLGPWSLVGCTVAPGFEFEGFQLAPEGWEPGG